MEYAYSNSAPTHANAYLWPILRREIAGRTWGSRRAFDLRCGNGATCNMLAQIGFDVTGVDTSLSGVALAKENFPQLRIDLGSAYDDLRARYGKFDLVVSLEVVEHCMQPRAFARSFMALLSPGGVGIVSTPYHGYLKNLALALTGKMDAHFTALWDGGHVKFFSMSTLGELLREAGARNVRFHRVGRIPQLAKSMIAVVEA